MTKYRRLPAILGAIALASAACGQAVTPIASNGAGPAVTTSAATTPSPLPTRATGTVASTEAPPPALKPRWEAAGENASTDGEPATYSPTVDPLTGDIWVAVSFDGVIWRFGSDGTYKGSVGKPGKGDGEFDFERTTCRPCGAGALAFAPDGTLFVADTGNNRIQKFGPDHKFVKAWGTFGAGDGQFADAIQIATNGHEVFVGDDARGDLQVFDMNGNYVRTMPHGGWLAIDPHGTLYVTVEGVVHVYDPAGAEVRTINLPDYKGSAHIGLAADGHGRLFYNFQKLVGHPDAIGLGAIDIETGESWVWSTGGETLAIDAARETVYLANYVGAGWPEPLLRAYELPAP